MISSPARILLYHMKKWSTDMKRLLAFAAVCLSLALTGCGATNGDSGNIDDAEGMLQYRPTVNEVTAVKLQRQDFPMQVLSNGKLSASSKASLYFRESGIVLDVRVRNGQKVVRGAVLAELENSVQKSALESARIELERATLDMQDALVGLGYPVSEQDGVPEKVKEMASIRSGFSAAKNNFEKARASLDGTVLKAPFSGRVADVKLKAWSTSSGSEPFCTIIGEDGFDVDFTVLESEYPFVEIGQNVKVSLFGSHDGEYVSGRITAINPSVDKNGQIGVKAHVAANSRMLDGMNVKVIVEKIIERQLVVPKKAVVIRDGLEVLFRYNENGTSDWVYVNTLKANSENYAVVANKDRASKLDEGDLVIVTGNLNLADGSKVSLIEE